MKPLFILPALMVLLNIGASLHAQEGGMTAEEANAQLAQDVAAAIADLDNAEFEKRDAALKNLIIIGEPAVPQLRQALKAKERGPEFVERATRVIELFEVPSRESNGILCTLSSDKEALKAGESAMLTVKLTNNSKKDKIVYVGPSYSGPAFETGGAVGLLKIEGAGGEKRLKRVDPAWRVGFCGTGAYSMYIRLPAGESRTYSCGIRFDDLKTGAEDKEQGREAGLRCGYCHLPAEAGDTVRLNMIHAVQEHAALPEDARIEWSKGISMEGDSLNKENARNLKNAEIWNGDLQSNEVRIKLLPAK